MLKKMSLSNRNQDIDVVKPVVRTHRVAWQIWQGGLRSIRQREDQSCLDIVISALSEIEFMNGLCHSSRWPLIVNVQLFPGGRINSKSCYTSFVKHLLLELICLVTDEPPWHVVLIAPGFRPPQVDFIHIFSQKDSRAEGNGASRYNNNVRQFRPTNIFMGVSSTGRQANELPASYIAFVFDSMEMFCRPCSP